jgi:hypothetical protein
MRNYISSDGRFTPAKPATPQRFTGTAMVTINLDGTVYITPAYPPFGGDPYEAIRQNIEYLERAARPTPVGGPWYLAWADPATGKEGRTEGDGWPTREAAESAAVAWHSVYPDRHWWPVLDTSPPSSGNTSA